MKVSYRRVRHPTRWHALQGSYLRGNFKSLCQQGWWRWLKLRNDKQHTQKVRM